IKPVFTQSAPEQPQVITPPHTAPSIKGANMGFSIKSISKDLAEKNPQPAESTSQPAIVPEEDQTFDENELNVCWQEYAGQMPPERKAIAVRMQNIRAVLLDETTFEILIDNEIIAKEFTALISEAQTYLQTRLKNKQIKMTVRVSEPTENTRPVTRMEKFQLMAQKNKALITLKEEFGLEFF
ncbi:MAG: DNA polymerase III subunit gamma/tau, partial [Mediterranea sp.]|nr:DNA polymerase III subunit gamma/tau [Mediterranea sp.]